jgi:hypothetical protein
VIGEGARDRGVREAQAACEIELVHGGRRNAARLKGQG